MDLAKQINYWKASAKEEIKVAADLLEKQHWRQAMFFTHLTLEKILKAHVCFQIKNFAPRTHNLLDLSKQAKLKLSNDQLELLADMNLFNLKGRYPDINQILPSNKKIKTYFHQGVEVYQWLLKQLPNL